MPLEFTVRGRVMSEAEAFRVLAQERKPQSSLKPKKTIDRDAATMSMGFVVTGYPSQTNDTISADYSTAIKAHEDGGKWPGEFAEFERRWLQKNRPKRIGRPYELRESADQCAALATRGGWLHVTVSELMKA